MNWRLGPLQAVLRTSLFSRTPTWKTVAHPRNKPTPHPVLLPPVSTSRAVSYIPLPNHSNQTCQTPSLPGERRSIIEASVTARAPISSVDHCRNETRAGVGSGGRATECKVDRDRRWVRNLRVNAGIMRREIGTHSWCVDGEVSFAGNRRERCAKLVFGAP